MSKTELEAALLARRTKQIELLPKVKIFLDSISRNSIKSKNSYSSGLSLLQNFLNAEEQKHRYQGCNCETILQHLSENKVNVYELLDSFVSYILATKPEITPNSISLYLTAIRSYFAFYDIDVIPSKFRRKVKVPKLYREDEEPIDVNDIRKILLNCNNRRLKSYLLVLASGGMRPVEGTAIRLKDIDLLASPTKVHIRKEYAKTKVSRDIYISDEATQYLKQWIDWKYRDKTKEEGKGQSKGQNKILNLQDLVFSIYSIKREPNPHNLYVKLLEEFQKLLAVTGMAERKENGIHKRRKITPHSFRRHAKSVISNQVNQDYSEWFLGHSKSPYYTIKEAERREIYTTKCMKYLTFLDYTTLEETGKNIEAKLSEKEKEIQLLRQRESMNTDAIATLSDQLDKVMQEIEILKKQKIISHN
ncbi:MAG TPA: site-specific integrase [Nitrososphaeraceae archaeon]|nr:site-specific integrase [Nitrososphaeraceae archaeon]